MKVDIWEEIAIKKGTAIEENWNEFTAFFKVRTQIYIMQLFERTDEVKGTAEKSYPGVPLPRDDDVIPERCTQKDDTTTDAGDAAVNDKTAPPSDPPRRRRLKRSDTACSEASEVPAGWGGSIPTAQPK